MTQLKPFTVAIVGGGIVGVILAIALRRRNIHVQLYERNSSFTEISASMGLNISAVEALKVCSPDTVEAYNEVMTAPSDPAVSMHCIDGYNEPSKGGWVIPWDGVMGGVHRGQFLEALLKRLPGDGVHFGKSLDTIIETENRPSQLVFRDGTTALADAVIGADGMGSHVRRYLLGEHHPAARARYAHQYCYRAVLSVSDARQFADARFTQQMTNWMGADAHVVTVPIGGPGKLLGVNALVSDPAPWPSEHKTVLPATKAEVVKHFENFAPDLRALIGSIHEGKVDRWALFDFAENPVPVFARGSVAIAGDAAHASTPHLGSGAMSGIEDAAVLAELLGDERMVGTQEQIKAAFEAYSLVRLPRAHYITEMSRQVGKLQEFRTEEAGEDLEVIERLTMEAFKVAWSAPVHDHVRRAKEEFAARMARA